MAWDDLAEPRRLLARDAGNGLELSGGEDTARSRAAADLPPLSLVDRLTLGRSVRSDLPDYRRGRKVVRCRFLRSEHRAELSGRASGGRIDGEMGRPGAAVPDARRQPDRGRGLVEDHERIVAADRHQPTK